MNDLATRAAAMPSLDVAAIRADFPILSRQVHGRPLVYLDNAATSQTPRQVIAAFDAYYGGYNANIHRGLHTLADEATAAFEGTRETVRGFLNAAETREIIFTRGTTEAINLVANSWGRANLKAGDEVLISRLEHHSNIVPWQMLAAELGFTIKVIPVDERGVLDLDAYRALFTERTRLVAVNHVSNAFGTVNPVKAMAAVAHAHGALILVDGAQATPHQAVDVRDLDADFYAFSGHKVYGPTGVGVLYGKAELLESMPPWQGGGEMIATVSFEAGTTFAELPHKFEAGTPAIAEVIALGEAPEVGRRRRSRRHRRLGGTAAGPRHRAGPAHRWPAHPGHCPGQGRGALLRGRRRPCPGYRAADRPARGGDPYRSPLCPAVAGPLRRGRHLPGIVRRLQHPGRDRRLRRGPGARHRHGQVSPGRTGSRQTDREPPDIGTP